MERHSRLDARMACGEDMGCGLLCGGVPNALRIILIFEKAFEAFGAAIVVLVLFGPWVAERIDAAALPKASI